ncbi:MAG: DMT family transporter [Epsilonproteobacteria bacterium]|nr:DMT family transporter [Campylobacterota bacterium]OIO16078.1 MAG: EamA family transporter [Helicobacteraceae bacterium CG1_02_36_14]PIP10209.1 MAG: EamA family transporter [Sulfurimonas sp. CG23_combo_of_CG06-09_8_20_14_all_36_33]PIS26470.1 MAG: EamA family transporter [Sulfurimonas sp. CG08_land_8_20_14_0_20_36_33]PIU33932.1 MAG: EamA family transporter [Sulfurimonas sp. CG07_land_8_20_14_0_80_36_56]PIV03760.1 MAG: EamA family transporter [Sulfurimonas sp. CG03_land_8_20_14_0_80_36_25]PI
MGIMPFMKMIKELNSGVKYMLLASLMFAFMGAFAKLASEHMSSLEVVFFRNIAGVILVSMTLYKKPMRSIGGKPWLLFFRGFMGFTALLAFFYNIANIPLGDAITFSKTSPIFTAIFAWIFLNEKLSLKAWLAIGIGFVGILLITEPSGVGFTKYDLLGIFSGIGAALAYTSIRELKKIYDTRAIVLSFMGVGTAGPIVLFFISSYFHMPELDFILGEFVMPQGVVWFYLLGMGIFATISQLLMTKAYGETKAGIVGAVSYSNIIFAIMVGSIMGDALPSFMMACGIALIILSGLMVARAK